MARDLVAPNVIEIGYQRLDLIRGGCRLHLRRIVEFIEGIVDCRMGATPAAPAPPRAKGFDRERQVIGRIPAIERVPIRLFDDFGATTRQLLAMMFSLC